MRSESREIRIENPMTPADVIALRRARDAAAMSAAEIARVGKRYPATLRMLRERPILDGEPFRLEPVVPS